MKNSKTILNKLWAVALVLIGLVPYWLDKDITALLFLSIFALESWFENVNVVG